MNFRHTLQSGLASLLLLTGCSPSSRSQAEPAFERRIDDLIGRMTLQEKIGQLNQLSTFGTPEAMAATIREGRVGSIINEVDPAIINAMQRIAVEESRLGIPLLFGRDVIHGFRTIFPIPLGLAATFDPQLVEEGARVAAEETVAAGVRWTFSPMLDIARDPRWGRIAEGSGEDTYLTTVMGEAMIRGYQGEGFPARLAACAKHFAGYGASEGGRDYNSTYIPERQMRNVYLPPFEAAVRSGALTVMTSFNDNDGIPSTGNPFLLRDILRDEWGFDGMVVTDWNSAGEMVNHGFAADAAQAAAKALNAGVDMDMMSHSFELHLAELVRQGSVEEKRVDEAVRNVLRLKFRLGLFDNPYADPARVKQVTYTAENLEAARRSAEESIILLQNRNDVLPLDPTRVKRLLVTGPLADAPGEQLGTWVFDGEAERTVTPLSALREAYGGQTQIVYERMMPISRSPLSDKELSALTAKARSCDAVVVFVGEEAILSGEAHCLANLNLQGDQSALIAAARRSGRPVVTVVMAGRPLTVGRDLQNTDALLWAFHPGTMGGPAIADLLFGKVSPSGKSPVSFPVAAGQIPVHYNHNMTGRPAAGTEVLLADISVGAGQTSLGCTSYLLDAGFGPLFPFGYGLSYTTFAYANLSLDSDTYSPDDVIHITFDLSNTGGRDATEVAQVYVRDRVGSVTRPVKELKAFRRVHLRAGESRRVQIELPVSELAFWNIDMERVVEPGDFDLWVAGDSASGTPLRFTVK